ncbi:18782_t:CDS:1, partial [Dentiscutata erythropus]
MPDPIWSHFIQLGRVAGFKQKRRECKYWQQQFNDALRAARTHFRNCKFILPEQKKNYFGDSYEDKNNSDSNISLNTFEISTPVISNSVLPSS